MNGIVRFIELVPSYVIVMGIIITGIVSILSLYVVIFVLKVRKNFERNEKFATIMLFTQPKAAFCFRLLSLLCLFFSLTMITGDLAIVFSIETLGITGWGSIALLIGFVYLFKILSEITKEREAEIIIKEGKAWLR